MRIGYFSSKFPYSSNVPNYMCGGSILATQSLVNEISKMGHDIKVFTTSNTYKSHVEHQGNVEIHRYGSQFKLMSSNVSLNLFRKPLEHDVDVVHISFDVPPGPFAGYRYAKKKDIPFIVTYHGDWDENYGNFIRRFGISQINKLVDKILSNSKFIISPSSLYINSSKYLRDHADKTFVIPNGINLNEFKINSSKEVSRKKLNLPLDKHIILFFGYLSPLKNPDILLKAFKVVLDNLENSILIFAGTGIMMDTLKKLSLNLKINNNVKFVGYIGKELRPYYYKSADIFCLPSSNECNPISILEAMASNLPVVASEVGGIPDIIKNGHNGCLVPPNDIEKLANVLIYLLKNENVREKFGKMGENGIKNFAWEKIAKETEKLYKTCSQFEEG
jgi:glycosyltransferase involved in cell wall biosynthesis